MNHSPAGFLALRGPSATMTPGPKSIDNNFQTDSSNIIKNDVNYSIYYIWLVVLTCFNHLEKYEFVNGQDDIPYMKWKIKHVPNHQPDYIRGSVMFCPSFFSRIDLYRIMPVASHRRATAGNWHVDTPSIPPYQRLLKHVHM